MVLESDLALAHRLADAADAISIRYFTGKALAVEEKEDGSPVTVADEEIEVRLRDLISSSTPRDVFLGEEFGQVGDGLRRWIVDAIDGTVHFVAGRTSWATLIALEIGHRIQLGVVSEPAKGVRSWAERGTGAWSRRSQGGTRRLVVSDRSSGQGAIVMLFPDVPHLSDWRRTAAERLASAWPDYRGDAAWQGEHEALLVARGEADAFLFATGEIWDHAALVPIVEEAGGRATDLLGTRSLSTGAVLYTNGRIHESILDVVNMR